MLETMLAYHCSPAMAGIKPSNLVACYKNKMPNAKEQIEELNTKLNAKDIYIDILCECPARLLLIIYRKKKLTQQLRNPEIADFLEECGYKKGGSIETYLSTLRKHLQAEDFPHEIGAFLGYPLSDIHAFIKTKGKGSLYVGDWKVYSNLESAKKMFCRYKNCRDAILRRIYGGQSLAQIFYAA